MDDRMMAELAAAREQLTQIETAAQYQIGILSRLDPETTVALSADQLADIYGALLLFARLSSRLAGGAEALANNPMLAQMAGMFGL